MKPALNVLTSVLLISCPCAIALSAPFAYGMTLRIFGRNRFFLKNDKIIEYLSKTDTIVFDKTGTLTDTSGSEIFYTGEELSLDEKVMLKSSVKHSVHPASRLIYSSLADIELIENLGFSEVPGMGIRAGFGVHELKAGRYEWVSGSNPLLSHEKFQNREVESRVYISINGHIKGYYEIKSKLRNRLGEVFNKLSKIYLIKVLSGDNDSDKLKLNEILPEHTEMHFNSLPDDKVNFIRDLAERNQKVVMLGDGLNDAGALKASYVGIAVTDDTSNFTPSSDAVLDSDSFALLPGFLKMSKYSVLTVFLAYALSAVYNIVGLGFALSNSLTPVIAAILMPVSSISVVLFVVAVTNLFGKKLKLV